MRVLVYYRDSKFDPWTLSPRGDYKVIAETTSAYKISVNLFFTDWVLKKGQYEMCEVIKETTNE